MEIICVTLTCFCIDKQIAKYVVRTVHYISVTNICTYNGTRIYSKIRKATAALVHNRYIYIYAYIYIYILTNITWQVTVNRLMQQF